MQSGRNAVSRSTNGPYRSLTSIDRSTVLKAKTQMKRVLSPAAQKIIQAGIDKGTFQDRTQSLEPPLMAPSTKPDDYSKVSGSGPYLLPAWH